MKQKMLIFLSFAFLIAVLIGVNAVNYQQKSKEPDSESYPNRSTYNAGATGTRALYDLLNETGRKVTRWQESTVQLKNSANKPQTFVIVGTTRVEFEESEISDILQWVSDGGKLVIIDREPPNDFIKTNFGWTLETVPVQDSSFGVDPTNQVEMTARTAAVKPSQISIYTQNVNAVQPSRFASSLLIKFGNNKTDGKPQVVVTPFYEPPPTPKATPIPTIQTPQDQDEPAEVQPEQTAPFVHLSNGKENILVDFPYGRGEIVFLTDPYIVSNAGIGIVDNAQLAVNIITSKPGLIAFDEFHQGFGTNRNTIFGYFAETPVIPIFAQILLLIGALFWSQSRRFARPLPADEPNRLSKLEYVSAMAELQQRTKAYDLAIENIYAEFRRSALKIFGMDNTASRKDLAKAIAERVKLNELDVYNVMRKCEEIVQGEPTNKRQVVELTKGLREIEEKLGVKRARKQAFRK